jgi:hypothetical protein
VKELKKKQQTNLVEILNRNQEFENGLSKTVLTAFSREVSFIFCVEFLENKKQKQKVNKKFSPGRRHRVMFLVTCECLMKTRSETI